MFFAAAFWSSPSCLINRTFVESSWWIVITLSEEWYRDCMFPWPLWSLPSGWAVAEAKCHLSGCPHTGYLTAQERRQGFEGLRACRMPLLGCGIESEASWGSGCWDCWFINDTAQALSGVGAAAFCPAGPLLASEQKAEESQTKCTSHLCVTGEARGAAWRGLAAFLGMFSLWNHPLNSFWWWLPDFGFAVGPLPG